MDLNKASMVIALTLFLTSVSFNIRPTIGQAQPPIMSTFRVEPPTSTGGVGETITLAVNVYDADCMYSWQVYMVWDAALLEFNDLAFGGFLADQSEGSDINARVEAGWLIVGEATFGMYPGVTADSGWLMSVDFEVLAIGETTIDIDSEYTYWIDSTIATWGNDPEEMIKENGYFNARATITYDAGNNIITVIGGTEESPVGFKDLWDADQANGWNVVHNNNNTDTQFEFDAKIIFGNGTTKGVTWLADSNKQIVFADGVASANWFKFIEVTAYAHFTLGVLEDVTTKRTSQGCHIIILENSYHSYFIDGQQRSDVNLYSSSFFGVANSFYIVQLYGEQRLWNCIFSRAGSVSVQPGAVYPYTSADLFNIQFHKLYTNAITAGSALATFDKFFMTDVVKIFYTSGVNNIKMTNIYARGITYIGRVFSFSGTGYLVNFDSDIWAFEWAGTCTGAVYRQYTFDLIVRYPNGTAIENANVTITHYGQAETEDYNGLTDSNGQIPQQTLSKGFYDQTGGNTIYSYEPYNLQIANVTGYNDYDGNFTLSEQTDWTITLTPATSESGGATYFAPAFPLAVIICLVLGIVWIKKLADTKPKEIQVMPK